MEPSPAEAPATLTIDLRALAANWRQLRARGGGAECAAVVKAKVEQEKDRLAKKLGNEKFIANADPEVVAADRERFDELEIQRANLKTALERVAEAG